ncbi:MAG: molybdopterin oxidoreductase family protein [Solirubrobacteraceae bacterium]
MTSYRTCPLCEATCGLAIDLDGTEVTRIRGDADDVFSHGFLCPKGVSLKPLHEDPDRLRAPLVDGREASWDQALAVVDERLRAVIEAGGRDAVAVYVGNPAAHSLSNLVYGRALLKALGTKNVFTASTVDQMPKQVAAGLMFGGGLSVPVPDVDRTDYLLVLGANPLASNGSLMTAPDMRGRLKALRRRGGRVVVVDPRRSRTAEESDEHLFIRPGTDALFLFALVHVLDAEDLVTPVDHLNGVEEVLALAQDFAPGPVAEVTGIPAFTIERVARELAGAPRAAVYGRIGTCTQEFGTLASWLVDVLNALTGNLDRDGGAMFPRAAAGASNTMGAPRRGRGLKTGRWQSRVRGAPEVFGELPVACLAEEIETPGAGQVRALVTVAGNPVLSTPDGARLDRALEGLDFMLSLDIYVNETTRHADVVLPAPSPIARSHYDVALYQLAIRNVANYSPPLIDGEAAGEPPDEWRTLLRLAGIAGGAGPNVDVDALDAMVAGEAARRAGLDAQEALAAVAPRVGPERILDILLRAGPYGSGFGARKGEEAGSLSLADLEAAPHGIDLGPLQPRLPEVLRTPSGMVELAPPAIVADVARLRAALERSPNGDMVLIGRRQLRSNNSWMHNLDMLVRGPARCTLHIHPDDAARLGLADGEDATVRSAAGEVVAPVEVTDAIMPGVVSIPHGWGHDVPGTRLSIAREHAGVNCNLLTGTDRLEPLSGNAILNGVPVRVAPVESLVVSR